MENKAIITNHHQDIEDIAKIAWDKISPFWPLENLIACNPLQGFENLPFEKALEKASAYFEQENLPQEIEEINSQTIKWCQAFFDKGQATIKMPNRHLGFYQSWLNLASLDNKLHKNSPTKIQHINSLPKSPAEAIEYCLTHLKIAHHDRVEFLTLMLTNLAGWASYVKYLGEWQCDNPSSSNDQINYLAVRLAITMLLWDEAKDLPSYYKNITSTANKANKVNKELQEIISNEHIYQKDLFQNILSANTKARSHNEMPNNKSYDAQLVFCIDVRSEPMRRKIEAIGNYQTFGFAGFFGVPVSIENAVTKESHSSCPVLLKPQHKIIEMPIGAKDQLQKKIVGFKRFSATKKFYQSLKYGFTTPFVLAEAIGVWSGGWMIFHSIAPKTAHKIKEKFNQNSNLGASTTPSLTNLTFENKLNYAKGALITMGLTANFAPLVIFCGHGSKSENNAYATALDCGACGGRHGGSNAKILATILNDDRIRQALTEYNINIPPDTKFIGAEHNTTNDDIELYIEEQEELPKVLDLTKLKNDIKSAQQLNSKWRADKMGVNITEKTSVNHVENRSVNWAETRPEWGLARNASFIIAKRDLTQNIDLDGRAFLHSYDYQQDKEGTALNLILTAPMVVAQWINSQYLFSTINNVAYGSGSKISQNVVGKIGIMQGNGSDLMHGLPLQSVFINDNEAYHQALRLTTLVHAPINMVDKIIGNNEILQKLFGNNWVHIACLDPEKNKIYQLQKDLSWQEYR